MLGLLSVATLVLLSDQCQEIRMIAEDGTVVVGRSLEFSVLDSFLLTFPKGTEHIMPKLPACETPFQFDSNFNTFTTRMRLDTGEWSNGDLGGMNEAGLSASTLYFPKFAYFPEPDTLGSEICDIPHLSFVRLAEFVLATFGTVQEIRDAMTADMFPVVFSEKDMGLQHPVHFQFIDKSGDAMVLEYTEATGRKVFNNTVGVFTNSPPFDWHMENLRNYPQLENRNRKGFGYKFKGDEFFIPTAGSGSGFAGLPGDYTSVSRFVKAVALLKFAKKPSNRDEALAQTFHLMNAADVPKGIIEIPIEDHASEEKTGDSEEKKNRNNLPKIIYDATSFIVVKSLEEGCIYTRAYTNIAIERICFKEMKKDIVRYTALDGAWKKSYKVIKPSDMKEF